MARQRCETCRFFQEAGLAGSGWCHHPQRKTTSDLLIMVRKNELACRDSWSHSLWEAGTYDDDRPDEGAEAEPSFAARVVVPATDSDIAAILQAASATSDAPREDVVLSEVRVAPAPPAEPALASDPAASYRDLDARAAIIKAREAYRERLRLDTHRLADDLPSPAEPPVAKAEAEAAVDEPWQDDEDLAVWADDPASEVDAVIEPDENAADEFDAADDFDDMLAAPRSEEFGRERWDDEADDAEFRGRGPGADSWLTRGLFGGFGRFIHSRPATISQPAPEPVADEADDLDAPEPEPALPASAADDTAWDADPEAIFDAMVDRLPDGRAGADARSDTMWIDDAARFGYRPTPAPAMTYRPDEREDDESSEPNAVDKAAAAPAGFEDVLAAIEVGPELAPELPRVCRTCRDFRPSESGGRGWCANRWAFSHRRVVDAQDAAPCTTSLGSWWLPIDEVWAAAYDISSHGQPTPLLEAWLGHDRDAEPKRRRS